MPSTGWNIRSLFRATRVVNRQGALKYNIPKRYARAVNDEVKLTWDPYTAAKMFGSQKGMWHLYTGIFATLCLTFSFFPWKYTYGDLMESRRVLYSDHTAMQAYLHFWTELIVQRNRAYEFMRVQGRPGQGMNADSDSPALIRGSSMAGFSGWDTETGRPVGSLSQNQAYLDMFNDNPELEKRYHAATKDDMARIQQIREQLADIRSNMTHDKQEMYKKAMM